VRLETALPAAPADTAPAPPVSRFEFWPGWLFYTPVVLHWLALGLRYRSFTLPTAANPTIEMGGLCGESKLAILRQVQGEPAAWLARSTGVTTHAWDVRQDMAAAGQVMEALGLDFPLVAKPDVGCNGTGVRLVEDDAALFRYLREFPRETGVLLQEYLPQENEAGLFYIRHPDEPRGRITSVTLKYAPYVVGDGRSTLRRLILGDPRAGRVPHLYLPRLERRLAEVPPQGERIRLVFVGNHCKGSIFRDGAGLVTPALTERMDQLARALPGFHFGRIDLRFDSLAALARGEGFRIMEINGVGSEATHIWDAATRLGDAWRTQFFHYGEAFRIAAANRARGCPPATVGALWRCWRRQKRLMACYPTND
jgi:hypothetical protein